MCPFYGKLFNKCVFQKRVLGVPSMGGPLIEAIVWWGLYWANLQI